MVDFSQIAIGGVSMILLVLGWVEAAKKLGLEGKWLTVLALVLGTLLAGLWKALSAGLIPAPAVPWIEVAVVGLGGGLAATGLYDLAKRMLVKPDEP
jgi:hypothetical protein